MEKQKIQAAPSITCFREPLGVRWLNFYVLDDGDHGRVLFDAGIPGSVTSRLDAGELTGPISRVIVSHSDADHFGDVAALKQRFPQMRIFCHPSDKRWIESHRHIVEERYDHARIDQQFGYPPEVLETLLALCGPDIVVDDTIEEGMVLAIGPRQWQVLHVPGHSHGHIALWSESDGILLLGDAVLAFGPPDFNGTPSMPSTHQFIADYLATIDRLEQLPAKLVLTGHWAFLDAANFKQLLADSRTRVQQDIDTILAACQNEGCTYARLIEVLNNKFRTWDASEDTSYMFALSGTLDYLIENGKLIKRDGCYYVS